MITPVRHYKDTPDTKQFYLGAAEIIEDIETTGRKYLFTLNDTSVENISGDPCFLTASLEYDSFSARQSTFQGSFRLNTSIKKKPSTDIDVATFCHSILRTKNREAFSGSFNTIATIIPTDLTPAATSYPIWTNAGIEHFQTKREPIDSESYLQTVFIEKFFSELYKFQNEEKIYSALTFLFKEVENKLLNNAFETCDKLLMDARMTRLSTTVQIGFLVITLPFKEKLNFRKFLFERLKTDLLKSKPEEVHPLLDGLR